MSSRTPQRPKACVAALLFLLVAPAGGGGAAAGAVPAPRSSATVAGVRAQANSDAYSPSVSCDGRYVAFESWASNLISGDTNGFADVFVYDRTNDRTRRVSVSNAEAQANAGSFLASISADGRFVAFQSNAANLVSVDTNSSTDVFVRDRTNGTTRRVSISGSGHQATGASLEPSISCDGRYIAFTSWASNLVSGDQNGYPDVFVHDRTNGTTRRVSVSGGEAQANASSYNASINGDGRFIAFWSAASNLVPGDTNGTFDVFVRDRTNRTTRRMSLTNSGHQSNGGSTGVSISRDGRFIAFTSSAWNLVSGDTNHTGDVFVHDRTNGTTRRVSVSSREAQANASSYNASISGDGRFIAFQSTASNLVSGDTNGAFDVFVRDRTNGTTRRMSLTNSGRQANARSVDPSINRDGRFIAFQSFASNLVSGDTNGFGDVFVHNRTNGTTRRVR